MHKENFLNLIEIQSILKKIETLNNKIEGEKKRVSDIENQLKFREELYATDKEALVKLGFLLKEKESNLLKAEKKLKEAKDNQKKVDSEKQAKAIDEEISSLEISKRELEDFILNHLDEQETLNNNIADFESFKSGVLKTLREIQNDVDEKIQIEFNEIKNLKQREENLISILPKNFQDIFSMTAKRLKSNSLAYIDHGKCGGCQMSIPSMICQEVESGTVLELCPSCGRILLPHQ